MSRFLGLSRRSWNVILMMPAVMVLLFAITIAVMAHRAASDAPYLRALISSYQNDAGLQGLRMRSTSDVAFTPAGLLTDAVKPGRCAAAIASMDRFKKLWIDARVYQRHAIHSHAIAAVLLSNSEALAARNGCIPLAAFDAFLAQLKAVRDYDLGIHSFGDLVTRFPLPGHDGYRPVFFTEHGFDEMTWRGVFDPPRLRELKCAADVRCDPVAVLKQAYAQTKPRAS